MAGRQRDGQRRGMGNAVVSASASPSASLWASRMLPLMLILGGVLGLDRLGAGHDPLLDDLPGSLALLAGFGLAAHRGDPAYWELRYEDMVRRPEPVLRAQLHFLELPWSDRLLVAEATGADADTRRAAGPVAADAIGRWRNELAPAQCAALEPLIGPLLETLGYADGPDWAARSGDDRARIPPIAP